MISPGKNRLLVITEEDMKFVRDSYSITREDMVKHIDNIIEWYENQANLPQISLDRDHIERLLITNKCSIEKTKMKLEKFHTTLHTVSELFVDRNPKYMMDQARKSMLFLSLPKLSNDGTRVFLTTITTTDTKYFELMEVSRHYLMIQQYKQLYDYAIGDTHIADFRNLTFKHVFKASLLLPLLTKVNYVDTKILGNRVAVIHILSDSWIINTVLTLMKIALPAKLMARVKVHSTLDSILEDVPKEILPVDYGGEEKSVAEFMDDWEAELCSETQIRFFKEQEQLIINQRKIFKQNNS